MVHTPSLDKGQQLSQSGELQSWVKDFQDFPKPQYSGTLTVGTLKLEPGAPKYSTQKYWISFIWRKIPIVRVRATVTIESRDATLKHL
jgi:hypothetical protein